MLPSFLFTMRVIAAAPSASAGNTRPDEGLDRAIGPFALGANAVNLAVGAGIFALPATVAALLGPGCRHRVPACGLTITCVLLCCAELGSQITRSGGVMAYTRGGVWPDGRLPGVGVYAIGCCALADAAIAHVLMDALAFAAPPLGRIPRIAAFAPLFGRARGREHSGRAVRNGALGPDDPGEARAFDRS